MNDVVVDTSAWIDFFAGRTVPALEEALARRAVVLAPIVAAELVSGARHPRERASLIGLLREFPVHETPLDHWVRVGLLRRQLSVRGLAVSTSDAHVAQCALDRQAGLLSRDAIFTRIARLLPLRLVDA